MNQRVEDRVTVATFRAAATHSRGLSLGISSLCALGLLGLASCVTQRQYDDAVSSAKYHQTTLHEKERQIATLEEENARLKRAMAMNDVNSLQEASFGGDLEGRLSELQSKIDALNRPLKDIERFDVAGGYVLMVQDKILFDSGSSELNQEGRDALAKLSVEIQSKPHGRIWVRGHTDSDPVSKPATKEKFPHGNLQLSAARAVEVASQLTSQGKLEARDVAVMGFGQYDPIRPNNGADNKRLNRRVEIFVSDKG